MDPYQAYSAELTRAYPSRGYPIANPQPGIGDDGLTLRPIEVGDVGFILGSQGNFVRMFNVHLEPGVDGQPELDELPDTFQPLPNQRRSVTVGNTPIWKSHSVTVRSIEGSIGASAAGPVAGGSAGFSATRERGAILATPDPIESHDALLCRTYKQHAVVNIENWHEFARNLGFDIELEDIMLVTGVDRTTSWATAVFTNTSLDVNFGINIQFANVLNSQLATKFTWTNMQGATVNSGPTQLGSDSQLSLPNTLRNQSLFIRRIRCKRRRPWRGLKLVANADVGDDDVEQFHDSDDDGLSVITTTSSSSPMSGKLVDGLEPVLDFILEHSEAKIAVAHDEDLGLQLSSPLIGNGVEIVIQGGIGSLQQPTAASNGGVVQDELDANVPIQHDTQLLSSLIAALQSRYKRSGDLNDLESAIMAQRRAIELTPEGHPGMSARLNTLGRLLRNRFERLGELDDLTDAISTQHRAIELVSEGHPDMPGRLNGLGILMSTRFERLGELYDLDNAILVQRRAVELTPEGHRDLSGRLNNLGALLNSRFERVGELGDLDRAISMQRRAVDLTHEGHPNISGRLGNLGLYLRSRFECFGELDDLDSAISTLYRAVELTPEAHPDLPGRLNNLGVSLSTRYERFAKLDDLESAISTQRRAVELTPDGHSDLPKWLNNLASSSKSLFERLGKLDDLDVAISTQRRAVDLTPENHPNMSGRMGNLGLYLRSRFERLGELDDLDSAIVVQRRAVELTPEGHPDLPRWLDHLGASFKSRFEQRGVPVDLERAISAQLRAVKLTPEGHSNMLLLVIHLGRVLLANFRLRKDQRSFDVAVAVYKLACRQATGLPSMRLESSVDWLRLETQYPQFGSPASRLRAHSHFMNILPEMVWLGYSQQSLESAEVASRISDAVSAVIEFGDLPQAIQWLDMGRSLVDFLRSPLDELAQHHPDLAKDLQALSGQLQSAHLTQLSKATSSTDSYLHNETNQSRPIVIKYDDCLKKIRTCPGFEDFLRLQNLADLASMTERLDGPVVFINVSSSRCDALVLFGGGAVKLVPLPELKQTRANTLSAACTNFLSAKSVRMVLNRAWKWVVCPILEALDLMNPDRGRLSHITWCPTGSLTQLPLHAAGVYPESGPSGPHAYDFVVSSYTPSLSALLRAQNCFTQEPSPSLLIVTQSGTPEQSPHPESVVEGTRPEEILTTLKIDNEAFSGDRATVQSVEAAIRRFPWVHLSCRGVQDMSKPTQSAFILHDGSLTLSTLRKTVAEGSELAFLSDCQTATGDEKAPRACVPLTVDMLAVGFKGVVGTMWSYGDPNPPALVEAYYSELLELRRTGAVAEGSTGAAYALHEAVKRLRETVGEAEVLGWVPFVHYGV